MAEPETNFAFYDLKPSTGDMRDEVIDGLTREPKQLSPKFFYNESGSELFEAITRLPEYYLTRTEIALFDTHLETIAATVGAGGALVEYGSGSSRKVRMLLDGVKPKAYVPVDISGDHLNSAARKIHADFPWLEVYPTCADYTQSFALPPETDGLRKMAFFPGSSIGNFEPSAALGFLRNVVEVVGSGGELLIGVDRKKSVAMLEAAYNDAQGVTADFNRNMLAHINRSLGADFDLSAFDHEARYNAELGCIQMFLQSNRDQVVNVDGNEIRFARGEDIHTENSYKYHPDEFINLAEQAGFSCEHFWTDGNDWFAIYLLVVGG